MYLTLEHDGRIYSQVSESRLQDLGIPQTVIDDAKLVAEAKQAKATLRQSITHSAGDQLSILGTTADGTALAIYGLACIIKILNDHGSSQLQTALNEAANGQLVPLANNFLNDIETGNLKLPALIKGLENVVADISARSNAVADILEAADS